MRTATFLLLGVLTTGIRAQPGEIPRYLDPCGLLPNDSIDITHDGIPDLVVQVNSNGTDDEPSSSGNCQLHVMNLPGTTLLNTRDARGMWGLKACAPGDSIPALSSRPQDDLQIPKELYTDGSVQVANWGYGHQIAPFTAVPGVADQRHVFQTIHLGMLWHGSFSIEEPTRPDQVTIRVGVLVPADQAFLVR